jgi:hypothetical protein
MEKIYVYGIGREVSRIFSCKKEFKMWKSRLSDLPASRVAMLARQNDSYFAALGGACKGRTAAAASFARGVGYASCEDQRAAIEEIAAASSYEADVKAYQAWCAKIMEKEEGNEKPGLVE